MLAKEDSTIPKNELQGLTVGSNLQWIVRKALQDWVSSYILAGDSRVALCWVSAENKPLAIFQRNRAIQIRSNLDLENLYHVRSESNPSDVGTRSEKVTLGDVGPASRWENGDPWMRREIEQAVNDNILKPVSDLRINDEEESEFRKGLIFEKVPEILTRGHVINETRVSNIEKRVNFSKYVLLPTKFSFAAVVRILSHVMNFISSCRKGQIVLSQLLSEGKLWFSVFTSSFSISNNDCVQSLIGMVITDSCTFSENDRRARIHRLLSHFAKDMLECQREKFFYNQIDRMTAQPTDKFVNMALLYLYRKASDEIRHFYSIDKVKQISVDVEGVLLSKGRLLDTMNYRDTGELSGINIGDLGVKPYLPVIDRFSPLAYSIAEHIHWRVAIHKGVETCTRISKENVSIIQAHSLFKEFSQDCIVCKKKRKHFLEVEMGPISASQLLIAPPFWMCQCDLFGPITVVVPGFERATRNRRVLEAKCWVMAVVCPTTRLVNLQVLESSKASGWIDAFTRLACEVGCPTHVFCDQDSAGMSAFKMAEVELRDLKQNLSREKGIQFSTCPVTGHDKHGHVERVIRSIQESFADSNLLNSTIHATGLQTICKLVENQYNNLPLGYHYGRDDDNSALLKIITPNMLRVGRINKRALDGPLRLPKDRGEIMAKVCEIYDSWFRVWAETMVPKLMFKPKWFKSDKDLNDGDLVYFPRNENSVDSKWMMGIISKRHLGRDGLIRVVDVKYRNSSENIDRVTERSIRKIVKLWSIDDMNLADDLAEIGRKFKDAQGVLEDVGGRPFVTGNSCASFKEFRSRCLCCCAAHHSVADHLRKTQLGGEPNLAVDLDSSSLKNLVQEADVDCDMLVEDDVDCVLNLCSKIQF